MDHRDLRRAGLDYREFAHIQEHQSYRAFAATVRPNRLLALSTRGRTRYTDAAFARGDALVFGPETRGLPDDFLLALPPAQRLCIPMRPGSRSLNLSNAVAIVVYEAWRQLGFPETGPC